MLSSLQAAIMALVTTGAALAGAYVPSLKANESLVIAAIGAAVGLGILVANAVVTHAHAKVAAARVSRSGGPLTKFEI